MGPVSIPAEDRILKCHTKDANGLNDFHMLPDLFGVDIDKVGINNFRIPMNYRHKDGTVMNHDTVASMYIHFPRGKAGINMSRLYEILQIEAGGEVVDEKFFRRVLNRYKADMRDEPTEDLMKEAYLKLRFNYPLKQDALKSDNWGWQYYECELEGHIDEEDKMFHFLTVHYQYSSTCPCSFSMSKQYESEHAKNEESEGNGMAVPHSQRSQARCTIKLPEGKEFFVEDLVGLLRQAIPTETQSFVKRPDEQAFAIMNADNPMFVEHASRRISHVLNAQPEIEDWVASIEHWESLHSHNAVAVIRKGVPGGMR